MENLSLLAGGQEHTLADWERETAAVLRKSKRLSADADDSLVWSKLTRHTLDGLPITPLGTSDLIAGLTATGVPGAAPFTRGLAAQPREGGWDNRPFFANPDANAMAQEVLTDLENGATSVWIAVGSGGIAVESLRTALGPILLDIAPVTLETDVPLAAGRELAAEVAERGITLAPGSNLGADPVGRAVRATLHGTPTQPDLADLGELAALASQIGAFAVTVDATAVHDGGASEVQELGYALAAGVTYLRALVDAGVDAETAAGLLEFRLAATDEQFPTIAKFRAARQLWARVCELSGIAGTAAGMRQHAVTSRPMMTKYDPWVNMLRTTVAAFAAGVGGAGAVSVLPFDEVLGLPDAFARRIARNTSSLLISESHVARVVDPAGGSFMVEKLTADLAESAWAEFGAIEAAGGLATALADGSLAGRIADVVSARNAEIAKRKRPITGVSEFPNLGEDLPDRTPQPAGAHQVARYAAPFESLRDHPPAAPVFLATLGSIAAHTARATFASNLLATGGIDTAVAGATDSPADVVTAYQQAGTPRVVCLAGSDAVYAEWGAQAARELRAAGAQCVILAGKAGEATVAADVIDDQAAMGVDALAFVTRVREELGK